MTTTVSRESTTPGGEAALRPAKSVPPRERAESMRGRRWLCTASVLVLASCSGSNGDVAEPEPGPAPALADGNYFAMVIVGEDEVQPTFGVDVAEMLTGEEARQAAIADGVISEGEDLPNDFYIQNSDAVYELLHVDAGANIEIITSSDVSQWQTVSPEEFAQIYEGTHPATDGFYVAALQPVPMDVTVSDGSIRSLRQVYLP